MTNPWGENAPTTNGSVEKQMLMNKFFRIWRLRGADEVLYLDPEGNREYKSFSDAILFGASLGPDKILENLPTIFFFKANGYILGAVPETEAMAFEKYTDWVAFFDPKQTLGFHPSELNSSVIKDIGEYNKKE